MAAKRGKGLTRLLIWLVIALVLLLAAFPLWLPWVLRPAAARFHLTFKTYDRLAYTRFAVTGAVYTNRNVRVTAGRVEVSLWPRRAAAQDWAVMVSKGSRSVSTNATRSVHGTYRRVGTIVNRVQHWIPQAALTNGFVQTPSVRINLAEAYWEHGSFFGRAAVPGAVPSTIVRAKLPPSEPVVVGLETPAFQVQATLTASNLSDGLFIEGSGRWRTNDFNLTARFGGQGALPERAELAAKSVSLPEGQGEIAFRWQTNHYVLHASGNTEKQPLKFDFEAIGDLRSATIQRAEISAPWASAHLESPLPVRYQPPFFQTNASLRVRGDLAKQQWFYAEGQVEGRISLRSDGAAEYELCAPEIRAAKLHLEDVNASGAIVLSNLAHHGTVAAQRTPLGEVALRWTGRKFQLDGFHAKLVSDGTTLSAKGAANLPSRHFQISALAVGTNELDFQADVQWPARAQIRGAVTNLASRMFGRTVIVDRLHFSGGWQEGPVTGEAQLAARTVFDDGSEAGVDGAVTIRPSGVNITNLVLTHNRAPASSAHGFLPVSIVPGGGKIVVPGPGPLRLDIEAHRAAFFWRLLEERGRLSIAEPDMRIEMTGTWKEPRARVSIRASQLRFREVKPEVPPIEALSLLGYLGAGAAEIDFLNFFITNQPINFSAHLPLPANFWSAPRTNLGRLDWQELSCRVRIDNAHLAAFAPLLSTLLVPQGAIDANFGLVPGGKLDGYVRIDGAATRPLPNIGALQDIEILCRFAEQRAQVNSYVAAGGDTLLGAGEVQLDLNRLFRGQAPPFEFKITGENIPLTRQVDAVIRADIDATLKHVRGGVVDISGKLNLRDSLYLRELRDLVPGRLASVQRRPPYFSVPARPFTDWRLELSVTGDRFLKVRTPIFNGQLSADFTVSGTLGDPVAVGQMTVNEGVVRFPFGNIPITHGMIFLASDNPYRPQLLITGAERILGYDLNMELHGYADAPVLQFSSTPPLSSEQILLMLTAGEIPRQGQFAFSAEQRAQRVALFLGRGMLADLGFAGDSNRLTIRSGENVTDAGRPTYSVEYELTDDWSVIGQYDRFNDFNLMLKWRVYSK